MSKRAIVPSHKQVISASDTSSTDESHHQNPKRKLSLNHREREMSLESATAAMNAYKYQLAAFKKQLEKKSEKLIEMEAVHNKQKEFYILQINEMDREIKILKEDIENIRTLNRDLQKVAINNFDQSNASLEEIRSAGNEFVKGREAPVGYVTADGKKIYLG